MRRKNDEGPVSSLPIQENTGIKRYPAGRCAERRTRQRAGNMVLFRFEDKHGLFIILKRNRER